MTGRVGPRRGEVRPIRLINHLTASHIAEFDPGQFTHLELLHCYSEPFLADGGLANGRIRVCEVAHSLNDERAPPHSITSSARASRLSGTLRPSALAVFARRERPRRCAAEQGDELAAPHSITSSARASSVRGPLSPTAAAVLR